MSCNILEILTSASIKEVSPISYITSDNTPWGFLLSKSTIKQGSLKLSRVFSLFFWAIRIIYLVEDCL